MSCKGCKDRHIGCHGSCEEYIAFRKELDDKKKLIRDIKTKDSEYRMHREKQVLKAIKRGK